MMRMIFGRFGFSDPFAGFSDDDLARQGIDAVLAFQVSPLDLLVSGNEINPDAALRLSVQAKIVDTNSGAATPNWSWEYRGSSFDYFDLAAEDARLLRLSIDECYPEIARLMVSDLFVESGASSSGGEALRQSGEAPLQTGRLETPPSDAAKPTLDEVKRIVRRIDATVERDSIEFLKAQQVVPEDSIRIGLVSWDIIAVTRDSFTLEVFLRFRTGASETFKLRGRIDDEKVIYTEVLAPESESVR